MLLLYLEIDIGKKLYLYVYILSISGIMTLICNIKK